MASTLAADTSKPVTDVYYVYVGANLRTGLYNDKTLRVFKADVDQDANGFVDMDDLGDLYGNQSLRGGQNYYLTVAQYNALDEDTKAKGIAVIEEDDAFSDNDWRTGYVKEERILAKRLDLTGQRFGKLAVLCTAEDIGDRSAWVYRCECGREPVVRTSCLRRSHTKSCGCADGPQHARQSLTYADGTCVEVLKSKKARRNNTSGVREVSWISRDRLWRATIFFKGKSKSYYLGGYRNLEDAVKARKEAEEDMHSDFMCAFSDALTLRRLPTADPRPENTGAASVCGTGSKDDRLQQEE